MWYNFCFIFSTLILATHALSDTKFTIDLADRSEECFYEELDEDAEVTLDYQVRSVLLIHLIKLSKVSEKNALRTIQLCSNFYNENM